MARSTYSSDTEANVVDKRWRWLAVALTLTCGLLVFWELSVYDEAWNACPFTTNCKDNVVDTMDTSRMWAYAGGGAGIGAMLLRLHPRNRGLRIGLTAVAGVVLFVRIGIAMSV